MDCNKILPGGRRYSASRESDIHCRYLAVVKRRGHAMDPVAHFHLQNGAAIWRLNWMGDVSTKGLQRSYGLMVNYHYHLPDISRNSDQYRISRHIALSDSVQDWTV
jgi:malonyl-CoA decarboxylase